MYSVDLPKDGAQDNVLPDLIRAVASNDAKCRPDYSVLLARHLPVSQTTSNSAPPATWTLCGPGRRRRQRYWSGDFNNEPFDRSVADHLEATSERVVDRTNDITAFEPDAADSRGGGGTFQCNASWKFLPPENVGSFAPTATTV